MKGSLSYMIGGMTTQQVISAVRFFHLITLRAMDECVEGRRFIHLRTKKLKARGLNPAFPILQFGSARFLILFRSANLQPVPHNLTPLHRVIPAN